MSKLKSLNEFKSENKLNSNELSQVFGGIGQPVEQTYNRTYHSTGGAGGNSMDPDRSGCDCSERWDGTGEALYTYDALCE